MSRLDVCRICLAVNVTMHHIRNTRMQAVFEKLTSKKLTEKGRPETICYLCYSQLQKCRRIIDFSRKSENVFTQLANGGIEITENTLYFIKRSNIVDQLVTPVTHTDFFPNSNAIVENMNQVMVKEEQDEEAVEIKIETIEYDAGSEDLHENFKQLYENTKENNSQMEPTQQHSKSRKSNPLKSELVLTKFYICDICSKQFRSKGLIKMHINWHNKEKPYSCEECNQTFTFKTNLIKHVQTIHSKKRLSCNLCDKTFSRSEHLKSHKKLHTGERPYPCNFCRLTFKSPGNVQQHIRSVHNRYKPYVCGVCDKAFSRKWNLQEHNSRVHTGEKPYTCGKCDFKCSHRAELVKHLVKIHFNE